ncbi:MAG: rod shape-determining protein MreD [Elusimicrobia bacterium GWA2_61_42]|nr:MAG: rod shape-determining protein MreD [Elusimicrobia bacterium GWA2_61_42]OGR78683.1 MAG: rod shape-determining protein MreD [Elusimicrobia bacterium GWC2_61_25]
MSIILEVFIYLATGSFYWWWTQNLTVFALAPNLIFAAALCAAILAGPVKAVAWGFFLGLYADMLGASMFGGYALTYSLMAYAVYVLKRHFDMASPFSQLVAALVLSWACMLFYQALSLSFSSINPTGLKIFLVEPFLNALAVPVLFQVFYWFKRRTGVL